MRDFGGAVPAGPAISHAIPSNVFHDLKSDRWNSADYGVMLRRGDVELHAKLRDGTRLRDDACSSGALHCLRGHCTAWLLVQWCATWCIACLFGATRCQETAVTFAARSSCVGETAITFARPKCVFLRHCGRAKVSLVSCVPVNE